MDFVARNYDHITDLANPMAAVRLLQTSAYRNLYGQVGATYQVLYSTSSFENSAWQPLTSYTHTNVVQTLAVGGTSPTIFYRLKQQ